MNKSIDIEELVNRRTALVVKLAKLEEREARAQQEIAEWESKLKERGFNIETVIEECDALESRCASLWAIADEKLRKVETELEELSRAVE